MPRRMEHIWQSWPDSGLGFQVDVLKTLSSCSSLQANALIAEEKRQKRAANGSKGGTGSKPRRRKAGANKPHLLPDPPPVRDCYAALSAQRAAREREREKGWVGGGGREKERERALSAQLSANKASTEADLSSGAETRNPKPQTRNPILLV